MGDLDEPFLAKAISLITGKTNKAAILDESIDWKSIDRRSSRFDRQKQILLVTTPKQ